MINLKIYKNKLVNLKIGKNMTKDAKKTMIKEIEQKDNQDLLMSLKANEKAKKVLFLATNLGNNLIKLVPKMAVSVDEIITEINKRQDIKVKGEIDFIFLKDHLYYLTNDIQRYVLLFFFLFYQQISLLKIYSYNKYLLHNV